MKHARKKSIAFRGAIFSIALLLALGLSCPPAHAAGVSVEVSASPTSVNAAGQNISLTYTVTNNMGAQVTGLSVADPSQGGLIVTLPVADLEDGESVTGSAAYTVTQADIDAGARLRFNATASGAGFGAGDVSATPATVTVNQSPSLSVSMTSSPSAFDALGQTLTLTYTATNTGNTTLTNVTVSETNAGISAPAGGAASLAPGASAAFTATYTTTQGDLDAGSIASTSTATGHLGGTPVNSSAHQGTVPASQNAALTTALAVNPPTFTAVGDIINLTYTVTNTGNVTLSNVVATEAKSGASAVDPANTASLAPAASAIYTATYAVTQADLDAGSVAFVGTASGTAPGGATAASSASDPAANATVTGPAAAPALTLAVSANPTAFTAAGQAITLTYTVANTGNVSLAGVTVAAQPAVSGMTGGPTTLAPAASATFTATYTTTQADVDGGVGISFSATATGASPSGAPASSAPASASAAGPAHAPNLTLTIKPSPATYTGAGQAVTLTYTVKNTGNVTLTGLTAAQTAPSAATVTLSPASLAPGASATGKVTYKTTKADVTAKSVAFSGAATGTPPSGAATTFPAVSATAAYQANTDASIVYVLGKKIPESTNAGTADQPKTATVYVSNSVKKLRLADIELGGWYSWVFFGRSWSTMSPKDVALDVGKNRLYFEVVAEAGNRCSYRITIWRADEYGNYDTGDSPVSTATPVPVPYDTTLAVGTGSVTVTVGSDGGAVIPLTAALMDASGETVAIDLFRFGNASYGVLEIPASWFDGNGHYRRFSFTGLGLLEIHDRMMGNVSLTQSKVRITVKPGMAVSFSQDGAPLAWDNCQNAIVVGVPYPILSSERATDVALYQNRSQAEPRRVAPRSWYKDGMVYGYVHQNGLYSAATMITDNISDYYGKEVDDAARTLLARGVLSVESLSKYGGDIPEQPVTRAEFVDMLMRTLDVELVGAWMPTPPSDIDQVPEEAVTSVMQAVAMGIAALDEAEAFRPGEAITRQEMLVLTHDAMSAMNALPAFDVYSLEYQGSAYSDWDQVDEAAKTPIQTLTLSHILTGTELRPQAQVTQADAAQILAEVIRCGQTLFETR